MNCSYVEITSYSSFPRCTLTNEICPYMYRCTTKVTWLPLAGMYSCNVPKKVQEKIPEGACKVRFKKNNFLYVEYREGVVTVPYDKEEIPEYVFIEEHEGNYIIKE